MRKQFRLLSASFYLSLAVSAHAASYIIANGDDICGRDGQVCFSGRIDMDRNQKVIEISGRISRSPGAGRVEFVFSGVTPIDERIQHSAFGEIRGKTNEFIDIKIGPPLSNQTDWALSDIRFEAAKD